MEIEKNSSHNYFIFIFFIYEKQSYTKLHSIINIIPNNLITGKAFYFKICLINIRYWLTKTVHKFTYQIFNLLESPTARSIRYCPGDFFARFKLRVHTNFNQGWEYVRIDYGLDLLTISGRDIWNGPWGLFPNGFLIRSEQTEYAWQSIAVEDDLCLGVIASDDITDCSQSSRYDIVQVVTVLLGNSKI